MSRMRQWVTQDGMGRKKNKNLQKTGKLRVVDIVRILFTENSEAIGLVVRV